MSVSPRDLCHFLAGKIKFVEWVQGEELKRNGCLKPHMASFEAINSTVYSTMGPNSSWCPWSMVSKKYWQNVLKFGYTLLFGNSFTISLPNLIYIQTRPNSNQLVENVTFQILELAIFKLSTGLEWQQPQHYTNRMSMVYKILNVTSKSLCTPLWVVGDS